MLHEKTDREVLAEYGIEFDTSGSSRLSQFGGLTPVIAFLRKGRMRERLAELFGDKKARSILELGLGILAGAKNLEEVERVAKDGVIRKFLGNPVGAIELGRDFRSFSKSELESFHDWNRSLAILELAQLVPQTEELVFDVDATSVQKYGSQEGVEKGYIEEDKIEDCYQFLFFRLHNLNTFFYGTIRAGSAHSQNGWTEYLNRFLPAFERRWKIAFRADSGYFNERAFDQFSENSARFFIKAPMIVSRASFAAESKELSWQWDEKAQAEFASVTTRTQVGTIWREVYRRAKIRKPQLSLLDSDSYRYDCLATNDLSISEAAAFEFYNGRANVENNIKELKYDYQLGKIVTDSFDANDAITQVILFVYILVSHFKRTALPDDMHRMQLSSLRWKVFNIPGNLFRSARRAWIRIQNVFGSEKLYAEIFRRIARLRSWILTPPVLPA